MYGNHGCEPDILSVSCEWPWWSERGELLSLMSLLKASCQGRKPLPASCHQVCVSSCVTSVGPLGAGFVDILRLAIMARGRVGSIPSCLGRKRPQTYHKTINHLAQRSRPSPPEESRARPVSASCPWHRQQDRTVPLPLNNSGFGDLEEVTRRMQWSDVDAKHLTAPGPGVS